MSSSGQSDRTCDVCGKDVSTAPGVTHVYHDGRQFSLCCALCLDMFQRAPDRFARGERPQTVLEDLMRDLQWHDSSH